MSFPCVRHRQLARGLRVVRDLGSLVQFVGPDFIINNGVFARVGRITHLTNDFLFVLRSGDGLNNVIAPWNCKRRLLLRFHNPLDLKRRDIVAERLSR